MANVVDLQEYKKRDKNTRLKAVPAGQAGEKPMKNARFSLKVPLRFVGRMGLRIGRAMLGALVSMFATFLWTFRRGVMFVLMLAVLAMVFVFIAAGMNNWKDPELVWLSIAGLPIFLGLAAGYDGLTRSLLKLERFFHGVN